MQDVRTLNEIVARESSFVDDLLAEIGKVIVGQTAMVERILVGLLAGGMAHDFNNVLAIINGFTEIALNRLDIDNAHTRYLHEIHNAAQRADGARRNGFGY